MVDERRRYESHVRTAQADDTRRRIARAARDLFLRQGWGETTVRDVARTAGVSVPTVYAIYGNKKGLALALMDAADLAADPERLLADLDGADARTQLAASVAFDCRLFERAGDVLTLLREAGRTEPDLAAAYREGPRRGDTARLHAFSSWQLRVGVDPRTAVDTYAAICNLAAYTDLTVERAWPADRVESWWVEVLTREILGI
jgi:AcrR family transcriptional regulator